MDSPQTKKSQQNKFKGNPGKNLHTGKGTRAIEQRLELATKRVSIIKKT
jgi:hypothetical protein